MSDEEEGDMVEFSGVALDPFELEAKAVRFKAMGGQVVDYRSPAKLALLEEAKAAGALLREMVELSAQGGVDPEAIARCKRFVAAKVRAATEISC
jgi:hypothetical protein